jgi:type I restriction enzyme, R subunit
MYIDKPMKGHNLMQAIAQINRAYFEKQGGLIVDYLGVAQELKNALSFYAQSGGKGDLTLDQEVAIGLLLTKLEVVESIMGSFNYQPYFTASTGNKLNILKSATNYVADPQIKDRFLDAIAALSKIYALTAHNEEAIAQAEKNLILPSHSSQPPQTRTHRWQSQQYRNRNRDPAGCRSGSRLRYHHQYL